MFHSLLNLSANFWHISFKRRIESKNMPILFIVWVLRIQAPPVYICVSFSNRIRRMKLTEKQTRPNDLIYNAVIQYTQALSVQWMRGGGGGRCANSMEKINNIKSQLENETHDQLMCFREEPKQNIKCVYIIFICRFIGIFLRNWTADDNDDDNGRRSTAMCSLFTHTHTQFIRNLVGVLHISHSSKENSQFGSIFFPLFICHLRAFSLSQAVSNNTLRAWCCFMHKHQVHCRVAN